VETLHPGLADPVGRLIIQRRPLRLPLSRGRSHPKARCRRDTLIQRGPSGREERKHRIRVLEIDDEYKVPQSIEAYERHKKEGAVVISLFGTPQTYALTRKLTEDRIPGSSPGFGRADAPDGTRYPYIFPIAASYWSQAAASIKYAKDQLGALEGKKIAYLSSITRPVGSRSPCSKIWPNGPSGTCQFEGAGRRLAVGLVPRTRPSARGGHVDAEERRAHLARGHPGAQWRRSTFARTGSQRCSAPAAPGRPRR
jgi:Periplasmic binding protein